MRQPHADAPVPDIARGAAPGPGEAAPDGERVWIPGGTFLMGGPTIAVRRKRRRSTPKPGLPGSTGTRSRTTITVAERPLDLADYSGVKPEMLIPASVVFLKPQEPVDLGNYYNWWAYVPGAGWHHPEGPGSSLEGGGAHPVVHVAFEHVEAWIQNRRSRRTVPAQRIGNVW